MNSTDIRGRLAAAAMAAAAVCLVLGHLWNVPATLTATQFVERVDRSSGRFLIATVLTTTAALLLVVAATGIARLVEARSSRLAVVGSVLTAVGAAGLAVGVSVIGFTMAGLTRHDPAVARRAFGIASHDWFVSLPFDLAPLFTLGVLVLAVALLRTRAVPRWQPALLIIGAVAAVGAPGGGAAGAAGHAPLALALIALAPEVWRTTSVAPRPRVAVPRAAATE